MTRLQHKVTGDIVDVYGVTEGSGEPIYWTSGTVYDHGSFLTYRDDWVWLPLYEYIPIQAQSKEG